MSVETRLASIAERIRQAAERARRPADRVRLVAVGKTFPAEVLRQAIEAGQRRLGENRVQEARAKSRELPGEVEWHMVGHLQANKVRPAAEIFDWIHSVDSVRLARRLSRVLEDLDRAVDILVQVDLAGEETKHGIPEAALQETLQEVGGLPRLRLRGLMIIPPPADDPEDARPWFRKLRALADAARLEGLLPEPYDLSMGMSGDFEVAVEEGATLVRLGTAIFGPRPPVSG